MTLPVLHAEGREDNYAEKVIITMSYLHEVNLRCKSFKFAEFQKLCIRLIETIGVENFVCKSFTGHLKIQTKKTYIIIIIIRIHIII